MGDMRLLFRTLVGICIGVACLLPFREWLWSVDWWVQVAVGIVAAVLGVAVLIFVETTWSRRIAKRRY